MGKTFSVTATENCKRYTPTPVGKTFPKGASRRPPAVHPHACGENVIAPSRQRDILRYTPTPVGKTSFQSAKASISRGTPPRLWGKPLQEAYRIHPARYTPTPVGKLETETCHGENCPVHPQACGENSNCKSVVMGLSGTPPRLWGKRKRGKKRGGLRAVHPHACGENDKLLALRSAQCGTPPRLWGKLSTSGSGRAAIAVHPHACGENIQAGRGQSAGSGTPPRLWGKLCRFLGQFRALRYTPTPVGKTDDARYGKFACGGTPPRLWENSTTKFWKGKPIGTPPRLWGKRPHEGPDGEIQRYTPTPVGKTFLPQAHQMMSTVHPHACGENFSAKKKAGRVSGTPPRLWENPVDSTGAPSGNRYNPHACGENSADVILNMPARPVHPHACGENFRATLESVEEGGTPPRLWGKRSSRVRMLGSLRYTPTPVGKTPYSA